MCQAKTQISFYLKQVITTTSLFTQCVSPSSRQQDLSGCPGRSGSWLGTHFPLMILTYYSTIYIGQYIEFRCLTHMPRLAPCMGCSHVQTMDVDKDTDKIMTHDFAGYVSIVLY